ncbi:MAG: hypothetical protein DRP62_01605 [Planctomycetota bacterium]|nr:MAG: hypothetical protein DRP62_01605 [Planctomycetota bacterium]
MDENQNKQDNLLDTTDSLEAVGVFRGWKNFLFIIVMASLLLLQVSFWVVNTGYVTSGDKPKSDLPAVSSEQTEQINVAAKQVVAEQPNQPSPAAPQQQKIGSFFGNIKFEQLALLIRFLDFALILAAILYCLTMLFALNVSMLGRLGGINHISRAFFLSLVMVVLLLPWQKFFGGVVAGAMYSPAELMSRCAGAETRGIFGDILFYLRFTGYWLLVVLLLIFSQLRSFRWARATLRRLEVI